MQSTGKVVLAFVGVFIAGAIFGGLFTLRAAGRRFPAAVPVATVAPPEKKEEKKLPERPPPAPLLRGIAPALMQQFTRRLNLNDDQREKIRPIVARAGEDFQRLQREHLQANTRVIERMYTDVSSWLTDEQRTELEDMRRNWEENARKMREKQGGAPAKPGASAPATPPASKT